MIVYLKLIRHNTIDPVFNKVHRPHVMGLRFGKFKGFVYLPIWDRVGLLKLKKRSHLHNLHTKNKVLGATNMANGSRK